MGTTTTAPSTHLYGWCMSHDHDTAETRGGCPIQVNALAPCQCPCHRGETTARGYRSSPAVAVAGTSSDHGPTPAHTDAAADPEPDNTTVLF